MAVTNQLTDLKLEILDRCPMRCVHCSSESSRDRTLFVSPSQVAEVMREFVLLDGKQVEISGGEPLEHPELLAILDVIRAENLATTIYTTGTRVTRDRSISPLDFAFAEELRHRTRSLVFSLQAGEAAIHDAFTEVPGSFEATIAAIQACQFVGIDVTLHCVPTQINFESLPALIDMMRTLRVRRVSLLRFVPHGRGIGHSLALNRQQHLALRAMVTSLASDNQVSIRLGSPYSILQRVDVPACRAGIDRMLIAPDGTAYPCDAYKGFVFPDDAFANVFAVGLETVWTRSAFFREAREYARKLPSECRDCAYEDTCHGGCPAQRVFQYGQFNLVHRDPDCLQYQTV